MSDTTTPHRIDLAPTDWFLAPWRQLEPLPRPAPAPFDLPACVERLAEIKNSAKHAWDWSPAAVAPVLSPQEARFWLAAMTGATAKARPKSLGATLAKKKTFDETPAPDALRAALAANADRLPPEVALPLLNLLSPEDFVSLALAGPCRGGVLAAAFRRHVRPYLSAKQVESLRKLIAPHIRPEASPTAYILAASLGMADDVRAFVSRWPDGYFARVPSSQDPEVRFLVFGLGSAADVSTQARRLGTGLPTPEFARAWLAHTELSGLDYLRDAALAAGSRDAAEALIAVLGLVKAPATAPLMLELRQDSKGATVARAWLDEQVPLTVAGLVPLAAGRGTLPDAAAEQLRDLARRGHTALIEQSLAQLDTAAANRVRKAVLESPELACTPLDDTTTPPWLKAGLPAKFGKLPDWLDPGALPRIILGGHTLNPAQVAGVLQAIRESTLEHPFPVLKELKANADRTTLDAFAWALFERWIKGGAPSKEKWGLTGIGLLGGDFCAVKLTPQLREWPGQGQHKRATHGLEVLRAIGTEAALMQLNIIAEKVKFPALQRNARAFMAEIAKERGLTKDELADRLVPDLGLDDKGTRTFDFGPRSFKVVIGPDLKPMVREPEGKVRGDLPKPNAKDDATKAAAAVAEWKLLKKLFKDSVKVQSERLEKAMLDRRTWAASDFRTYLVGHPVMSHVARTLLWGCFDTKGACTAAFRATEDRELVDAGDDPFALPPDVRVGVVHPMQLAAEEREKWGQVFGDYELVSPFPQLGRAIFTLDPAETKQTIFTRYDGSMVSGWVFLGLLKKDGWSSGYESGWAGGAIVHHMPEVNLRAVIRYQPELRDYGYGYGGDVGEVALGGIYFLRAARDSHVIDPKNAIPLGEVEAMALSETIGQFARHATSKG
jgi:hypothetical protein